MTSNAESLLKEVQRIAKEVAGPAAAEVDRDARFPQEAFDALRKAKALSAGIPVALGGGGLDVREQGKLCTALSHYCSSASMVLGMHFIKVASIVHHGAGSAPHEAYLREIVEQQRLVASMTSEEGIGGNLRTSIAAAGVTGERVSLIKHSTCLSYVEHADDILITCRSSEDAPASDQVVVLAKKGDYKLTIKGGWDPMGMRGTCSPPCTVEVDAPAWQRFDKPFAEIAARTMVPETHILWSHIWLGIAEDAVARARSLTQKKARKNPGSTPTAQRLARLQGQLQLMRDNIEVVTSRYLALHAADDGETLGGVEFSIRINELKINSSELVRDITAGAMEVCGFLGYLNDSDYSVTRHMRDAYSAAFMIGNGRLTETNSLLSLVHKGR